MKFCNKFSLPGFVIMLLFILCSTMTVSGASLTDNTEESGWPDRVSAPYVDTTLWSTGG